MNVNQDDISNVISKALTSDYGNLKVLEEIINMDNSIMYHDQIG